MKQVVGRKGDAAQIGGQHMDALLAHRALLEIEPVQEGRHGDPEDVLAEMGAACFRRGIRIPGGNQRTQNFPELPGQFGMRRWPCRLDDVIRVESKRVLQDRQKRAQVGHTRDGYPIRPGAKAINQGHALDVARQGDKIREPQTPGGLALGGLHNAGHRDPGRRGRRHIPESQRLEVHPAHPGLALAKLDQGSDDCLINARLHRRHQGHRHPASAQSRHRALTQRAPIAAAQRPVADRLDAVKLQIHFKATAQGGQRVRKVRVFRHALAVGVEHDVLDRLGQCQPQDIENGRMVGRLAPADLHHLRLPVFRRHVEIQHAFNVGQRKRTGSAWARITTGTRPAALIRDFNQPDAGVLPVVGTKSAIKRTAPRDRSLASRLRAGLVVFPPAQVVSRIRLQQFHLRSMPGTVLAQIDGFRPRHNFGRHALPAEGTQADGAIHHHFVIMGRSAGGRRAPFHLQMVPGVFRHDAVQCAANPRPRQGGRYSRFKTADGAEAADARSRIHPPA